MTSTVRDSAGERGNQDVAIVVLGREYGSADSQALAELEEQFLEACNDFPAGLLIDLSETIYVGSELLSVLLRCHARVKEGNGRFALCMVESFPRSVLGTTHLDSLWEVYPTRREAVLAMQRPSDHEHPRGNPHKEEL